jgi:hypothetical protein
MSWRNVHLVVGAMGLLLFVLQGQYMVHVIAVETLPDGPRLMYRTAHLYLMLASVANISYGYCAPMQAKQTFFQTLASMGLLIAGPLFVWSFLYESTAVDFDRLVAVLGLYGIFGSGVLLLLNELWDRRKRTV